MDVPIIYLINVNVPKLCHNNTNMIPKLGTFKWVNPDRLNNLEINNKRRTSVIKS